MTRQNSTTQTADYMYVSDDSPASTHVEVNVHASSSRAQSMPRISGHRRREEGMIERAVYSHIRAVRTLGRTQINTSEIADALSLSINDVNSAITKLKRKGIRIT